jgi:hypothetical protein
MEPVDEWHHLKTWDMKVNLQYLCNQSANPDGKFTDRYRISRATPSSRYQAICVRTFLPCSHGNMDWVLFDFYRVVVRSYWKPSMAQEDVTLRCWSSRLTQKYLPYHTNSFSRTLQTLSGLPGGQPKAVASLQTTANETKVILKTCIVGARGVVLLGYVCGCESDDDWEEEQKFGDLSHL